MACAGARIGLPRRATAAKTIQLPDRLVLIEYQGIKDRDVFAKSALTGNAYTYGTTRPRFYVDATDLSRVLAWSENGDCAFRVVVVVDNGSRNQED